MKFHRTRLVQGFILLFVITVLGRVTIMCLRADRLVHPPRQTYSRTPSDFGITDWQDVTFPSRDGTRLRGWFVPAQNGTVVILVHGLSVERSVLLPQAAWLVARGYGALLFDLRNHGTSDGNVSTLGFAEAEDVRGAIAFAQPRARNLALLGHSMGASAALGAAAHEPAVQAIIAVSAYTSASSNINQFIQVVTGLPEFAFASPLAWLDERATGIRFADVRPIDDVPLIAPRAILFVHGERDSLVLAQNSIHLYHAAREPKQLYLIPDAAHNDVFLAHPAELEKRILDFLAETIK